MRVMPPALFARHRFGIGAKPGDATTSAATNDATISATTINQSAALLLADLDRFDSRPAAIAALPDSNALARQIVADREALAAQPAPQPAATATATAAPAPGASNTDMASPRQMLRRAQQRDLRATYLAAAAARFDAARASDAGFAERLVHFWANHFAVSVDKAAALPFAGPMEFEAIRPHIAGHFTDLLLAVETHPAMLLYLDQAESVGPDSVVAQRINARPARAERPLGLNENLAREILELHTLGVDGGYSQADVTEFARALTGITLPAFAPAGARRMLEQSDTPGAAAFVEGLHQPGERTLLGRRYAAQRGDGQMRAILSDLATHPKTAHHLSWKLARAFVADDPPAALVDRLTAAWLAGGGALTPWYRALLTAPESWAAQPGKVRDPWQWTLAAARALGWTRQPQPRALATLFDQLAQPVWQPGSPAGYDVIAGAWLAPDALFRRLEAAPRIAAFADTTLDPRTLAAGLFGAALSPATAEAMARAESPQQALALMILSPDFLRS
jgi:uncharacterized protein (DUF1800 family)